MNEHRKPEEKCESSLYDRLSIVLLHLPPVTKQTTVYEMTRTCLYLLPSKFELICGNKFDWRNIKFEAHCSTYKLLPMHLNG